MITTYKTLVDKENLRIEENEINLSKSVEIFHGSRKECQISTNFYENNHNQDFDNLQQTAPNQQSLSLNNNEENHIFEELSVNTIECDGSTCESKSADVTSEEVESNFKEMQAKYNELKSLIDHKESIISGLKVELQATRDQKESVINELKVELQTALDQKEFDMTSLKREIDVLQNRTITIEEKKPTEVMLAELKDELQSIVRSSISINASLLMKVSQNGVDKSLQNINLKCQLLCLLFDNFQSKIENIEDFYKFICNHR